MKKISLIAGLAMLVTVGGVFAAWEFGTVAGATHEAAVSITVDADVTDKEADLEFTFASEAFTVDVTQDSLKTGYEFTASSAGEGYIKYSYTNSGDTDIVVNIKAELVIKNDVDLSAYMDTSTLKTTIIASAPLTCVKAGATNVSYVTLANVVDTLNAMDIGAIDSAAHAETFIGLMQTSGLFKVKVTVSA